MGVALLGGRGLLLRGVDHLSPFLPVQAHRQSVPRGLARRPERDHLNAADLPDLPQVDRQECRAGVREPERADVVRDPIGDERRREVGVGGRVGPGSGAQGQVLYGWGKVDGKEPRLPPGLAAPEGLSGDHPAGFQLHAGLQVGKGRDAPIGAERDLGSGRGHHFATPDPQGDREGRSVDPGQPGLDASQELRVVRLSGRVPEPSAEGGDAARKDALGVPFVAFPPAHQTPLEMAGCAKVSGPGHSVRPVHQAEHPRIPLVEASKRDQGVGVVRIVVDHVAGVPTTVHDLEPVSDESIGGVVVAFPGDHDALLRELGPRPVRGVEALPDDGGLAVPDHPLGKLGDEVHEHIARRRAGAGFLEGLGEEWILLRVRVPGFVPAQVDVGGPGEESGDLIHQGRHLRPDRR